jgi:hypothetical protein
MFKENAIVTLAEDKVHGEGDDAMKLRNGVCGMIRTAERKSDNNHLYVVDFGPYGQWYCHHNELRGNGTEGWDDTEEEERTERPGTRGASLDSIFTLDTLTGLVRPSEENDEEIGQVVNFEADTQRRIEELEKGV